MEYFSVLVGKKRKENEDNSAENENEMASEV